MPSHLIPDEFIKNDAINPNADIVRSKLIQEAAVAYPIDFVACRVHDAFQTNLPGTPLADDLGLVGGTFGSASPSLQTEDLKAAGATSSYARFQFRLPAEYDDGETITLRAHAGMLTTVSDTTATLDVECYKSDGEAGVGSDIGATAATTINSLTLADVDFTITPTGVVSGDVLDIRLHVAVNDAATGTAVKAVIGSVELLLDIKG